MRARSSLLPILGLSFLLGAAACGDDGGSSGDDDGGPLPGEDGGGPGYDAGPRTFGDATPGGDCEPEEAKCNNCIDDDGDGFIDGDDIHCAGPLDNDEETFATDIPGDNKDSKHQDCFFDGNSGDSCQIDTCCLFPPDIDCPSQYGSVPDGDSLDESDPDSVCYFDDDCSADCFPLTPPGCDCFGCCTLCRDVDGAADECFDIITNPAVSPNCTLDVLDDPSECVPCEKSTQCNGGECDPEQCILCPGQTEDDLPDECNNMNECPEGQTPCDTSDECGAGKYCSNSCCVNSVD